MAVSRGLIRVAASCGPRSTVTAYRDGWPGRDPKVAAQSQSLSTTGTARRAGGIRDYFKSGLTRVSKSQSRVLSRPEGHLYEIQAYKSLQHRSDTRQSNWEMPGWDECVVATVPLIRHMETRIMVPTYFSPLQ